MARPGLDLLIDLIHHHLGYPTTGDDVKTAVNSVSTIPSRTKAWVNRKLSNELYKKPDEVLQALNISKSQHFG